MTFHHVLAQATVTDLDRAANWYSKLFDRAPDAEPMPACWNGTSGRPAVCRSGPSRSGRVDPPWCSTKPTSTVWPRLAGDGIEHDGIQPISVSRALQLSDPDGNRIVVTGK